MFRRDRLFKFGPGCLCLSIWATQANAFCFAEASAKFGVPHRLLLAIAKVESGMNPSATAINKNGTTDYGLMQINSRTLLDLGFTPAQALEPCVNVQLGAKVLAENFRLAGHNWRAVGSYNTGPNSTRDDLRSNYIRKVYAALQIKDEYARNSLSKSALNLQPSTVATSNMLVLE